MDVQVVFTPKSVIFDCCRSLLDHDFFHHLHFLEKKNDKDVMFPYQSENNTIRPLRVKLHYHSVIPFESSYTNPKFEVKPGLAISPFEYTDPDLLREQQAEAADLVQLIQILDQKMAELFDSQAGVTNPRGFNWLQDIRILKPRIKDWDLETYKSAPGNSLIELTGGWCVSPEENVRKVGVSLSLFPWKDKSRVASAVEKKKIQLENQAAAKLTAPKSRSGQSKRKLENES